jgi:hypothetical protein
MWMRRQQEAPQSSLSGELPQLQRQVIDVKKEGRKERENLSGGRESPLYLRATKLRPNAAYPSQDK